jgi:hypothetical protein
MITSVDLVPFISHNPILAHQLFVFLITASTLSDAETHVPVTSNLIEILPFLPPILSTFDFLGRLLHDSTRIGNTTVADIVRTDVLGRFLHESVNWLDRAENEEKEGLISNDRFPKGVQNVRSIYPVACNFGHNVIRHL